MQVLISNTLIDSNLAMINNLLREYNNRKEAIITLIKEKNV